MLRTQKRQRCILGLGTFTRWSLLPLWTSAISTLTLAQGRQGSTYLGFGDLLLGVKVLVSGFRVFGV